MALNKSRLIVRCCYLGMFIQALVINLTPLLFIPLKEQLGLTYEQVGRLVLINFLTQMVVDLICCALADRVNPKPLIVAANLLSGVGLWLFALSPTYFATPYDGLILGTVVFSIGCGLLEVLLSPIINAVPSERKVSDMALLHAFYPVGKVVVIVVTAISLQVFGAEHWRWIMIAWTVLPFLNTAGFLLVKLPRFSKEANRQKLRDLVRQPAYLLLLLSIALAGATEVTIAQWTSAYIERGLGMSKLTADLVGFTLFGIGMIIGRLWVGQKGEHLDLRRIMIGSAVLSAGMCLVMSLSQWPWLSIMVCAPAGLFVSMLWPGSLSLSAGRFTRAGASMFALLSAAGDAGAALMPWTVGIVADRAASAPAWVASLFSTALLPEQIGLRAGLLLTAVCPIILAFALLRLRPSVEAAER
ncbi:MAG TPA: MFS transporter [Chthoniobacterales bacterium]|jgi:fucose permease